MSTNTPSTIAVDVVSAEGLLYSGQAEMVIATALLGEVGIYPRHAPMLAILKPGQIRLKREGDQYDVFYVSGGMLEVQPDQVTVLADLAYRAADLDHAAVEKAKQEAEQALKERRADLDYARASAELAQAVAQLQAIKKVREKLK